MQELVALTLIAMGLMISVGVFLTGIGTMRQARLAKRVFKLRYGNGQQDTSEGSNFN